MKYISGTIIDGTGASPLLEGQLAIQGNRFVQVGPKQEQSNSPCLDLKGKTILPGIINSHVHLAEAQSPRRDLLMAGVTSICDLGSPIESMERFTEFERTGPAARAFRSVTKITAPGGLPVEISEHEGLALQVQTNEEARAAVTELISRGADVIKIYQDPGHPWVEQPYPLLELEQLRAIVAEAHARDTLVRAHVKRIPTVAPMVDAHVDVFEHVPLPAPSPDEQQTIQTNPEFFPVFLQRQTEILDEQIGRMVEAGIIMVPTLASAAAEINTLDDPVRSMLMQHLIESVRKFHSAGGRVALGTDYLGFRDIPGSMPLEEMSMLLAVGLSPMEIITASTRTAAYVSGQGKNLGTLEPGKLADFIVVDGDPLVALEALGRVVMVIQDGQLIHSSLPEASAYFSQHP